MFDSNLRRGEMVDLDSTALYGNIVARAKVCTLTIDTLRRLIAEVGERDGMERLMTWEHEIIRTKMRRADFTYGARAAFRERTAQERHQAEAVVRIGAARFSDSPLKMLKCADCGKLIAWHIRLDVGGILCPFGREFWTYARALTDQRFEGTVPQHMTTLREIARATRRG